MGAVLLAVDVEGESRRARFLQLAQQFLGQGQAVGVDDWFETVLGDQAHDLDDFGMDEGISSGQRYTIGLAVFLENCQVPLDLLEGLVSLGAVLAVAPFTVQVAGLRDLEPGDGIIRQVPREPVVLVVVEKERHENSSLGIASCRISILESQPKLILSEEEFQACLNGYGAGLREASRARAV